MRIFVNEFCGHPFQMELSRQLAGMGHDVCHVYCADTTGTPKGTTQPRPDDPENFVLEGLHIERQFLKHSLLTRRQADIDYGQVAASRAEGFRPDVVISANMPLDAQRILQCAARRANAKFIFWVQDVYSVAARFVLRRKAKLLEWAGGLYFEQLEKKLMQDSDAVVCIADHFAAFVCGWGIPASKITVIANWAPVDEVYPVPRYNGWAQEHGCADRFCFMYSGTLGMKHKPELLLELAKHLELRREARLVVIAAGAGADWLASRAHEVSRDVLTVLPYQPYEQLPEVLGSADVLITLLDSAAGGFAVPSKTLSYLCAGRAQLVAAPATNEAARVVERARAGLVVSPDSARGITDAADWLLVNRSLCAEYGSNARAYAEQTFSITTIAQRFLTVLEKLLPTAGIEEISAVEGALATGTTSRS